MSLPQALLAAHLGTHWAKFGRDLFFFLFLPFFVFFLPSACEKPSRGPAAPPMTRPSTVRRERAAVSARERASKRVALTGYLQAGRRGRYPWGAFGDRPSAALLSKSSHPNQRYCHYAGKTHLREGPQKFVTHCALNWQSSKGFFPSQPTPGVAEQTVEQQSGAGWFMQGDPLVLQQPQVSGLRV